MTGDGIRDERMAELFRAAASGDAPPPRFDHQDVLAASRRITARRRSAVLGGVMAVLVVAGVGVATATSTSATSTTVSANTGAGSVGDAQAERALPQVAPAAPGSGDAGPAAGTPGVGAGSAGPPLGPVPARCAERPDAALRPLVARVIPEAASAPAPVTPPVCLPGTRRYLSLELGGGLLGVAYLPLGTVVSAEPDTRSAPTASGGTVVVSVPPAYRDRLDALLTYLAPRL